MSIVNLDQVLCLSSGPIEILVDDARLELSSNQPVITALAELLRITIADVAGIRASTTL